MQFFWGILFQFLVTRLNLFQLLDKSVPSQFYHFLGSVEFEGAAGIPAHLYEYIRRKLLDEHFRQPVLDQ